MFSVFKIFASSLREWNDRRLAIMTLSAMDDHQLSDIGIERGSIIEAIRGDMPFHEAVHG